MEQLVRIIPNIGSFVLIPTKEDVMELTEIRLMLETTTCRLAYGKNRDRLLVELRQTDFMIDGKSESDHEIRFDSFLEYDRTFHRLFTVLAENERLRVYYESIRNQADLFRTRTYFKHYVDLALKRHRGIIDALSRDRLEEAVSVLNLHIHEVESEILESLETDGAPKEYK
jgi:DNA-binding GntR family transcriptional regulator